jgi:IPT/TIG domain-containing protein/glycosyl transferase family WbsX
MAIRQSSVVTPVVVLLSAMNLLGCGGGSSGGSTGPPNPAPAIDAISPNSSPQGGPSITLSVVGSNFISDSSVQWKGSNLPTTFVSNALLTAAVPASAIAAPGPDAVAVVNPTPGGGTSAALNFAVPCVIPSSAPASGQTNARLGAYYFDGWSGPLSNFHFQGLPLGPYQDRQPFSAWQDNSICAVEQQLATAHNFGIDFFVFDWYFNVAVNDPGENLNSALQITQALPNRYGMQYAILYVDSPPFDVQPTNWTTAVNEWVGYMIDPDYVQVSGKPVMFIIDVGEMRSDFGTSVAVSGALQQLSAAAQAQGLSGVYVVGGFGVPDGTMGQNSLSDGFAVAQADGYDAIAFYNYAFAPPPVNGMLPFSTLSAAGLWTWNQAAQSSPLPFIPTAMAGWDPRPWNETESISGDLMWYSRTPQDVATLAQAAIVWAAANPLLRPEPPPTPPLVLIEAWNELGEGSYVIPTAGDGTGYGDAIAAMLLGP